jgi:hypothetical protein
MAAKPEMQSTDQDRSAEAPDSSGSNSKITRRRLMLSVAAAVPSVFTLSSGAQTSMVSGTMCRVGNWQPHTLPRQPMAAGALPADTPLVSVVADDYLRAPVYVGSYDGLPAHCVMENQQYCMDPMDPTTAAEGSVWIAGEERIVVNKAQKRVVTQISSSPQGYGLIFVNQEGTIATFDPQTSGLQPVTQVCWISIQKGLGPGRFTNLG